VINIRKRFVALATATAVAATTALAVSSAPASAEPTPINAAQWLVSELQGGTYDYPPDPSFGPQYGLAIDAALAMDAIGGSAGGIAQIRDALATTMDSYTTGVDFGSSDVYANASAKGLTFAQVAGVDPRTYFGFDLLAQTEARVSTAPGITGRLEDASGFGDFASVIGQAFAARSLTGYASPKAASAVAFLLQQQCTSGFFRAGFTVDKGAAQQGCVEGAADSEPAVDTTALAVLQLNAIQTKSAAVTSAIAKATQWLRSAQRADGSFGSGAAVTNTSNANSSGLAGWALGTQGECAAAGRAGLWLKGLQVVPGTSALLNADQGAIAYDPDLFTKGKAEGITTATRDQWRRATAQAAPALTYALGGTSATTLTGPTSFQRAGSTVGLRLGGVENGERACLTGPGITGTRTLVSTGSPINTTVTLPTTTGVATYSALTATGAKTAEVKTLGHTTLKAKPKKKKIRKGKKQVVKVRGLEAGEKVVVKVAGKRVANGVARGDGTFKAKFKIKGKLAKVGKKKVKVFGEFKDLRKGKAKFRVVR
jgi:hypothetical protein